MTNPKTTVAKNIKYFREIKGMQSKEMASRLGVAPSTYSQYENGNREPDVEKIKLIASILEVSTDFLLFGEEQPFDNYTISDNEKKLIEAYRSHPQYQSAVNKLLDVQSE